MVCDNINGQLWSFQIVVPGMEGFKNHKKFFVVYVIVKLCGFKHVEVKYN